MFWRDPYLWLVLRSSGFVMSFIWWIPHRIPSILRERYRMQTAATSCLHLQDLELLTGISTVSYTHLLYAPTAGIVCPFELNIAMAENAYNNGVEFKFDTKVKNIRKQEKGFVVETSKGDLETGCIVNAAGVYADVFHNMVSEKKLHITPRKGEYMLLDKSAGTHVNHTIFALPNKNGKGVLVTQTVHGNLLIGPTACLLYTSGYGIMRKILRE